MDIRIAKTASSKRVLASTTTVDLTSLGLPKSLISQLPQPQYFGQWTFGNGYTTLGRYKSANITNYYGSTRISQR